MSNFKRKVTRQFWKIVGTCVWIKTIIAFIKLHQVVRPFLHKLCKEPTLVRFL